MSVGPGSTLSRYRILEKLGEGGMGAVWKALGTTLERPVANAVAAMGERERALEAGEASA